MSEVQQKPIRGLPSNDTEIISLCDVIVLEELWRKAKKSLEMTLKKYESISGHCMSMQNVHYCYLRNENFYGG